jgi:hypothetical protein
VLVAGDPDEQVRLLILAAEVDARAGAAARAGARLDQAAAIAHKAGNEALGARVSEARARLRPPP